MTTRSQVPIAAAALVALAACAGDADSAYDASADLAAIDALHQADMDAASRRDVETLLTLWSDDPIALPPEGAILVGRAELEATLRGQASPEDSPWEILEYSQDFAEVQVHGEYGWDLGTVLTRLRHRERGSVVTVRGKLLRILQRQADGQWKVHRSAWSTEEPEVADGSEG